MSTSITPNLPTPEAYEAYHVHEVYEQIATHFSQTRYKPWPVVHSFLRNLRPGSIGLDIGCGNGKYLTVNKDIFIIASDRSSSLINIATRYQPHSAIIADTLNLPHSSQCFDFAVSIAVIHHLSSRERRVAAIAEIVRVLKARISSDSGSNDHSSPSTRTVSSSKQKKSEPDGNLTSDANANPLTGQDSEKLTRPVATSSDEYPTEPNKLTESQTAKMKDATLKTANGQALIFVWALEQKGSRRGWDTGDQQDVLVPWVLKEQKVRQEEGLFEKQGRPGEDSNVGQAMKPAALSEATSCEHQCLDTDSSAPSGVHSDGSGPKTFQRYYHLYATGELQSEVKEAGAKVVDEGYDRDNWWVVVEPYAYEEIG